MESNEQYRVKYTQTALKRLDDILAYIAVTLCNPSAAKRLLDDFDEAIENVSKFPYAMSKDSLRRGKRGAEGKREI